MAHYVCIGKSLTSLNLLTISQLSINLNRKINQILNYEEE